MGRRSLPASGAGPGSQGWPEGPSAASRAAAALTARNSPATREIASDQGADEALLVRTTAIHDQARASRVVSVWRASQLTPVSWPESRNLTTSMPREPVLQPCRAYRHDAPTRVLGDRLHSRVEDPLGVAHRCTPTSPVATLSWTSSRRRPCRAHPRRRQAGERRGDGHRQRPGGAAAHRRRGRRPAPGAGRSRAGVAARGIASTAVRSAPK